MAIRFFPGHREVRRAQARLVVRFFLVMAVALAAFVAIVAGRYLFGWW